MRGHAGRMPTGPRASFVPHEPRRQYFRPAAPAASKKEGAAGYARYCHAAPMIGVCRLSPDGVGVEDDNRVTLPTAARRYQRRPRELFRNEMQSPAAIRVAHGLARDA